MSDPIRARLDHYVDWNEATLRDGGIKRLTDALRAVLDLCCDHSTMTLEPILYGRVERTEIRAAIAEALGVSDA